MHRRKGGVDDPVLNRIGKNQLGPDGSDRGKFRLHQRVLFGAFNALAAAVCSHLLIAIAIMSTWNSPGFSDFQSIWTGSLPVQKLFLMVLFVMSTDLTVFGCDDFTFREFEKLHAELVPQNETWKTIPWHTNLLSARRAAVEQKKLIFIWAMDGHPLGCT